MWSDGEVVSTPSSASTVALPFAVQPRNAENPTFGLRQRAFGRRQIRIKEGGEAAVPIGMGEPGEKMKSMWEEGRPVPQIMHLLAFKPELREKIHAMYEVVMRGPSPLSPGQRELIAAFTSKVNGCGF